MITTTIIAQINSLALIAALIAGALAGLAFFAGLWLTVTNLLTSKYAAGWMFLSFLLRTAIVLFIFYLAGGGSWERLLACLAGFVLTRAILIRRLQFPQPTPPISHERAT